MKQKTLFEKQLNCLIKELASYACDSDNQWSIKGFIDCYKNIYTISTDTKIISKILEIHLFPKLLQFAQDYNYKLVLATSQNYYPDMTFISESDENIRFAVDIKTTYRIDDKSDYCNGFTLGSHGEYFINRTSTKNIQFPYNTYKGHFCLGAIYQRATTQSIDQTSVYTLDDLQSIASVINNIQFFVAEKWKIASDKQGSGNTANIGSIKYIPDILAQQGTFSRLGEKWFDDYWINYKKINIVDENGVTKTIDNIEDFVRYRKGNIQLINSSKRREK